MVVWRVVLWVFLKAEKMVAALDNEWVVHLAVWLDVSKVVQKAEPWAVQKAAVMVGMWDDAMVVP